MMRLVAAFALAAAGATPALASEPKNLIVNGGFERPALVDWFKLAPTGTTLEGWSVIGKPGDVAVVRSGFSQRGLVFGAAEGRNWLDLTGGNQHRHRRPAGDPDDPRQALSPDLQGRQRHRSRRSLRSREPGRRPDRRRARVHGAQPRRRARRDGLEELRRRLRGQDGPHQDRLHERRRAHRQRERPRSGRGARPRRVRKRRPQRAKPAAALRSRGLSWPRRPRSATPPTSRARSSRARRRG